VSGGYACPVLSRGTAFAVPQPPLEQFLRMEAGSASLLMAAALAALVWSNLAAESYRDF
jgi:hypothetical protein